MRRSNPASKKVDFDDCPDFIQYNDNQEPETNKKDDKQFSLTLLTPERGEIPLPTRPPIKQKAKEQKGVFNNFKKKDSKESDQQVKEDRDKTTLPCPKFSKLGDMIYCVYNANIVSVYQYSKDAKTKKKKLFEQKGVFTMDSQIKFVRGNKKLMLIAFQNQFVIIRLQGEKSFQKQIKKSTSTIIGGCFEPEGEFIIITHQSLTKYYLNEHDDIITMSAYKLDLKLGPLKFIQILKDQKLGKYLLIFAEKKKVTYNNQSRANFSKDSALEVTKNGQSLQIIELGFQSSQQDNIYEVSNIPQQGIFQLSKAFYQGQQSFLLSLFQEIIVVRKQFQKYIVVDNTAIANMSVTDDSKTGQLVLVDKHKVVYNDHQGINVYDLLYVARQDKIQMQSVDNFSPIDQSQFKLYDGVLLESGDTNMQVLFYFDNRKIMKPGKKNMLLQSDQKEEQKYKLRFSVYAIVQSEPIQRLIELLKLKRPQNQINEFRTHFNISPLQFYKSQWSVSQKSLNDIINNLLQISDQEFIQSELDTVLKKQSTTLNFLIKIQQKQLTRLKKVILQKLQHMQTIDQKIYTKQYGNFSSKKQEQQKQNNKEELIKIIKKLLQSKMFLKKLRFQNEFQAYKIIDFIEINKIREMSLKQQIKLLSSKGYQKRLKQFLNQFKYLAIANFQGIFQFLMQNKDEREANQFLSKMGFMFPLANNPDKQQFDDFEDDPCILWEDFQSNHQISDKNAQGPQTIDSFVTQLFPDQNLKSKYLRSIMQQFIQTEWFKQGAFKKHCKLSIKYQELSEEFNELKTIKVYNILYKYLFENIKDVNIRQQIISSLLQLGRLPQGFMVNMRIRQQVYNLLIKLKLISPSTIKLPDFLILSETEYFKYLTVQNAPPHMFFQSIKGIYERVVQQSHFEDLRLQNVPFTILDSDHEEGKKNKNLFQQCFQKSMENTQVPTQLLVFYLHQFTNISPRFQQQNLDLLEIILIAINKKFRIIGNIQQSLNMIELLDKIVFKQQKDDPFGQICSIFLEITLYHGFWKNFNLDYSFYDVHQQQSQKDTTKSPIIQQAIEKYCRNDFEESEFQILQLIDHKYKLEYSKKKINIRRPTDFFSFVISITNKIGYAQSWQIFYLQYFLVEMLKNQRFDDITQLNVELFNFVEDKDPRQFMQQLILKHVKQVTENNTDINGIYDHVVNSLNLVVPITIRVKQQRAFLDLCKYAYTLDYRILSKIPNIRQQLHKPSLIFMMNIWTSSNIEQISYADPLKTRMLMQNIYQKYKQTTSFDINFKAKASLDVEFLQFQIERGYQYLQRKLLTAALQVCKILSNQDKLYFSDLVYSLTCEVGKTLQSTNDQNAYSQYIKLIQFSITHNSISQVIDHLDQILQSEQSIQYKLVNALSILSKMVKVYIQDKQINNKDKIYYQMFFNMLMSKSIQAFYFLMKNKNLNISKTIQQIKQNKQIKINKYQIAKYLALSIYIRSLAIVVKDFFPTYSFLQEKQKELSTDRVKRDINILASKLKLLKKDGSQEVSDHLMFYYNLYMESLSLSGYVDLTKIKDTTELDIDREMGQISKQYLKQKQQIEQSKRKYQELMKNINSKPKPIPIPTSQQSYRNDEPESPIQLPSRKYQKYQEIKRRQLNDLKKVQKQFVRQETSSNVDKILQMFKQKKQQRLNNLRLQSQSVRQKTQEISNKPIQVPRRVQPYQRNQFYTSEKANDSPYQIRQRMFQRPMKQRIEQELRKKNIQKPQKPYTEHFVSRNGSEKLDESIISNMSEFREQIGTRTHIDKAFKQQSLQHNMDQLKKTLLLNNQNEVLKFLNKFQLVYENQTLGKQFIKKIFQNSQTFNTWTRVIEFIIKNYDIYSKLFEIKTLKLCSQLLKIDIKIDPKLLFDLSYFSFVVPNTSQQKYYERVFEHLKPAIMKLVDDNNVHALAKGFFYGMGLVKKYQNMIYIYYLDARLQQYLNIPFNPKQQQLLLQKLKSSYCKLVDSSRDQLIKQLFRDKLSMNGNGKIKNLIKLLEQSMDRTSKIKNIGVSKDDENLLRLLKSL